MFTTDSLGGFDADGTFVRAKSFTLDAEELPPRVVVDPKAPRPTLTTQWWKAKNEAATRQLQEMNAHHKALEHNKR